MKRSALWILVLALSATGCTFTEPFVTRKPEPEKIVEPEPVLPAVTADGISERNAQERAQQLREELEREARRPIKIPTSASGRPTFVEDD